MEPDKIIKSKRKSIEIQISSEGKLIVRAPIHATNSQILDFVQLKSPWVQRQRDRVLKNLQNVKRLSQIQLCKIPEMKHQAFIIINKRVGYYTKITGLKNHKVRISSAKTRWGSCSVTNNLSFNWRLILAPECVLDYVVIHEIIHIKHKNHSKIFWKELEKYYSDYKNAKKWLRDNSSIIKVN